MKQGTNFILPVVFKYDLQNVESIQFICKQDGIVQTFDYPSDTARLSQTSKNTIQILWTKELTYKFVPNKVISLDSRIHLIDSDTNPQTQIIKFQLAETLFDS